MANFIERYRMKRKVKENMTKKKTPVQGTMKGKPIDTTGGPSYMKKTTKPSASTMDGNAYTPTQLKPVGPNMSKINRNTTDNKKPSTKKKSRGLVTMPSMQNKYL